MTPNLPAVPVTLTMNRIPNAFTRSRCILPLRSYVDANLHRSPAELSTRGVATGEGGISVYIPPPKKKKISLPYKFLCDYCLFFLFDPGQIVVGFEIGMTS